MTLLRTDPELLAAFRAGERRALETVYRGYVRQLDGHIRALARAAGSTELSQATVVQDLLQEAFIRAFSTGARHAYDQNRDFLPYLKAIARNCFVDALRKRKSELPAPEVSLPEPSENFVSEEPYEPEVLAALEAYLVDLPAALRGVYQQRFVLGRSQVVACAALGLSRRSLRTQEEHLRRGLRKMLLLAGLLRPEPTFGQVGLQTGRG